MAGRPIPPKIRAEVEARDLGRCRWCGAVTSEMHHIVYRSQGGKDAPENLITLCAIHHRQVHSNKRRYMPILLATLDYHKRGMSVSVRQVERWLGSSPAG